MAAECSGCGQTPWLAAVDGDFVIRCACEVGLAVDSVENRHYVPANWESCGD